jgi:hypothetical protein
VDAPIARSWPLAAPLAAPPAAWDRPWVRGAGSPPRYVMAVAARVAVGDRARASTAPHRHAPTVPVAVRLAFLPVPAPERDRASTAAVARDALAGSPGHAHPDHPDVLIHDDARARAAAADLGAHGFAVGRHVVVGDTGADRGAVLRHELRHARQVRNFRRGATRASPAALEAEAEADGAPQLGADPDEVHGLWWVVPVIVGGYILLDPDPANAPGPDDPVYPAKPTGQRIGEAVMLALPAGRLAAGGATVRTMMMWGGASSVGHQAVGDLGRGEVSPWNVYAGRGASGAIGWGLPMGPMGAFSSGARGLPLFGNFVGYGTATGLGLRASHDLADWRLSSLEDYATWGAAGFGAGLLGATVVTGLDFVATMAVTRSNAAISRGLWDLPPPTGAPTTQTLESLQAAFARRPDLPGRLGQCYLESRSLAGGANFHPRLGTVNVGGGHETPQFTNLNPFMEGTGGPTAGVSNHVRASFEQIELVFEPGSVQALQSSRLPASTVDWPTAAAGAHRVMAPGGSLQINVWSSSVEATENVMAALRNAGFQQVRLGGSFTMPNGVVLPIESSSTGSGVIISAVR